MAYPSYPVEALAPFYNRIGLPEAQRRLEISSADFKTQYDYLATLIRCTNCTVPFENAAIHYSEFKTIAIDPDSIYRKIVGTHASKYFSGLPKHDDDGENVALKAPRGGYCMEINGLFGGIMRTLGYDVCTVGGRVYAATDLEGWGHMVNIVTIGGHAYSVDVGFGSNQPIFPLPIPYGVDAKPQPNGDFVGPEVPNLPGTLIRLVLSDPLSHPPAVTERQPCAPPLPDIPESARPQRRVWVYQVKLLADHDGKEGEWKAQYGFTMQEFLPFDFERINYWTSTSRTCFFTYKILAVRGISRSELDDSASAAVQALDAAEETWREKWRAYSAEHPSDETAALAGQMILFERSLKIRIVNDTYHIADFKTETERIAALKLYFAIRLTAAEQRGINGLASQIT